MHLTTLQGNQGTLLNDEKEDIQKSNIPSRRIIIHGHQRRWQKTERSPNNSLGEARNPRSCTAGKYVWFSAS